MVVLSKKEVKKLVRKEPVTINPIMIIRSPRENPDIEANFKRMNFVDQLWVKHYPVEEANRLLLAWVKAHKDNYTHVIMTTDDVTFEPEDLKLLIHDLERVDFPILTGVCNFCTLWCGKTLGRCDYCEEGMEHEHIAATRTPLKDTILGGYLHKTLTPHVDRDTYDFITEEWRKKMNCLCQVYFHGIALTFFRMDIFLQLNGLHLYNKDAGLECDDVQLAIQCHNLGIPQFADLRVFVRHHGEHTLYKGVNTLFGELRFIPKTQ